MFEPGTVPMSTYLVAFVICDYENLQSVYDPRVRVWTPKGLVTEAQLVLDLTPKVIDFLEEYTQQPYLLPKIDHVAVQDFESAAMENWGIITYM